MIQALTKKTYRGATEVIICQTVIPNPKAQFAMDIMKHIALALASPDGEDSAGRQQLKVMPENEVVDRAVKIADLAWDSFEKKNWTISIPLPVFPDITD